MCICETFILCYLGQFSYLMHLFGIISIISVYLFMYCKIHILFFFLEIFSGVF